MLNFERSSDRVIGGRFRDLYECRFVDLLEVWTKILEIVLEVHKRSIGSIEGLNLDLVAVGRDK